MFYAWKVVKRKPIFDTNTFSVDNEKTSCNNISYTNLFKNY